MMALRDQIRADVVLTLGADLTEDRLDESELRSRAAQVVERSLTDRGRDLPGSVRAELAQLVLDDALGLGPLEPLLRDDTIGEIMVNGADTIYVERAGVVMRDVTRFDDESHLRRTIDRIVARVGRRIDESSPMVDARLQDGSRVNAIVPPVAIDGTSLTVRRFSRDPITMNDLVGLGTISQDAAGLLALCVAGRLNILVSGGTGSGKTTMLSALSSFIPENERLIDRGCRRAATGPQHLVRLESRPASVSGSGEVGIGICCARLRMRPDRIIIGESGTCRAGHVGGHEHRPRWLIGHCARSSVRDALRRIETMVLISGVDIPVRAVRDQIGHGIDLVVHPARCLRQRRWSISRRSSGWKGCGDAAVLVRVDGMRHPTSSLRVRTRLLATYLPSGRTAITPTANIGSG
jgi:pilus assembly protein CpaF